MAEQAYKISQGTIDTTLSMVRSELESQGLREGVIEKAVFDIRGELEDYSYTPSGDPILTGRGFREIMEPIAVNGIVNGYFKENPTPMQDALDDQREEYEGRLRTKDKQIDSLMEGWKDAADLSRADLEQTTATVEDLRGKLRDETARADSNGNYAIGGGFATLALALNVLYQGIRRRSRRIRQ